MTIGQVAAQARVKVQTLRYYERRGLLREPPRRQSGYREYAAEAVRVVRFIKQAQGLGFTLDEISQLLDLAAGAPRDCRAVRSLALLRMDEIARKIALLDAMRRSLGQLVETCKREPGRRECPLLEALEGAAS